MKTGNKPMTLAEYEAYEAGYKLAQEKAAAEREAREKDLRLRCLELAVGPSTLAGYASPEAVVERARAYAAFVLGETDKADEAEECRPA